MCAILHELSRPMIFKTCYCSQGVELGRKVYTTFMVTPTKMKPMHAGSISVSLGCTLIRYYCA